MNVLNTGDAGYPEDESVLASLGKDRFSSSMDRVQEWKTRGVQIVRDHPVASILGAFAIGIIIAKVAHRE